MTELEKLEKELLQEIQEEPGIYENAEEFCTIDPETRTITVPLSKRILGTESDQETNRLYFKCPKVVGDNVDLSLFSLRINYQNAGNKKDQYLVEDVKEEGDTITFSWLLKRSVTAYKGNVKFVLCAVKTAEDGAIKNEWNTTLNTECESLEGMEVDKVAVEEETKDIVEQLIVMMNHSAENAVRAVEEAKAEVDKEVGDFALKAQQALADVNNAGQAQTERVQTAGNAAVENIQTTQGTATEAVETAKSEAIQAIQAEGTTQTGNVTTEGTKQVQAIADKGKEVLQSIPEDFQIQMGTKLDKNQGAENAGKALVVGEDGNVVPQEETTKVEVDSTLTQSGKAADAKATGDKILQFAIKNTVTGDNPLIVSDSAEEKMQGLKVFGKSEQVQTTGAQLFNINDLIVGYYTTDGNVDEANINRLSTKLLDLQSGQTDLYIAGLPVNVKVIYIQMGVSGVVNRESGIMSNIKKKIETNTTRIGFSFYKDDNSAVSREELSNCMINYGVSAKPYEPYTGGKPSPNPECPQEIKSVGNNGTIEIKINGNNLISPFKEMLINKLATFQYDSYKSDELVITRLDGVKQYDGAKINLILKKGSYIFAYDSIEGEFLNGNIAQIKNKDEKYKVLVSLNNSNYKRGSFTLDKTTNIQMVVFSGNIKAGLAKIKGLRLGFLQEDNRWELYKEQILTTSTPNGLLGLKVDSGGNYTDATGQQWICDEIDLGRGKYVQRVKKINASDIKWAKDFHGNNTIYYRYTSRGHTELMDRRNGLSNRFLYRGKEFTNGNFVVEEKGSIRCYFDEPFTNIEELEQWFSNNPTYFVCPVIEPIERDLSISEIEAYKNLHSNYPTTNISNDENAGMEVSYIADTKLYIDKKFEELNQAIVNTQIALL